MRNPKLLALGLAVALAIAPGLTRTAQAQAGATVSEIEDEPEQYIGQNVTVSGEVADVYGAGAFTIGGGDFFGEELLIIVPTSARVSGSSQSSAKVAEGDIVQVSGQVVRSVVAEIENDYDLGFDLDDYDIDYEREEPALIANQLLLSPRGLAGTTISEIEDDPQRFMGRTVTVSGEAADIYGPYSFTIGGDDFFGEELLVILPTDVDVRGGSGGAATISDGDVVQVSGEIVQFIKAEIENDYDLGFDLDDYDIDYEREEPALIANQLLLSPRGMESMEGGTPADTTDTN